MQVWVVPQVIPQPPQLFGSVCVLMHAASEPVPHSVNPALQEATVQLPATHADVPLGVEQTLPQPPQLFGSV